MREAAIPAFAGRPDGHGDADAELLALYQAQDWPAFFALAVKAKKTIAATGSTGSGKTSLLRRLMQEIPGEERLVTIEDTDEFGPLPLRNRVSLFYGSANVSAENAVEASLRMRPDRVAMQELRGAEAFAYLRLLAAGHPGGLTTWHAEEGDPFTPLALMAKTSEAGRNIPDDKLLAILRGLIDIVAFCRRDARGFSVPSVYYRAAGKAGRIRTAAHAARDRDALADHRLGGPSRPRGVFVARRRFGAMEQGHRNTIHAPRLVGCDAMVAGQLVGGLVAGIGRGGADDLPGDAAVRAVPGLATALSRPAPVDGAARRYGATGRARHHRQSRP